MQVLDDPIDVSRMLEHDVPVDVIVTPTRVYMGGDGVPEGEA